MPKATTASSAQGKTTPQKLASASQDCISIKGARVNNLKDVSVDIPKNKLVVITGLSGSGKSSLAFDTIYAEGQRQYLDSMSSYARQFIGVMDKPDVDQIDGLSPVISIDQKTTSKNPRSTVGTITEIYDYLRLLFAKAGTMYDTATGKPLKKITIKDIMHEIAKLPKQTRIVVLSPVLIQKKGKIDSIIKKMKKASFHQVRLDGTQYALDDLENVHIDSDEPHDLDIVMDFFFTETIRPEKMDQSDLYKAIKEALDLSNGMVKILRKDTHEEMMYSQHLFNPQTGEYLPEITLQSFSFNSPQGACATCTGLGVVQEVDAEVVVFNNKLSIAEGAIKAWTRLTSNQPRMHALLEEVAKAHKVDLNAPVQSLKKEKLDIILQGSNDTEYEVKGKKVTFEGIVKFLEAKYKESDSEYIKNEIGEFMLEKVCPACEGKRLRSESLAVTFDNHSIADLVNMDLETLHAYFAELDERINGTKQGAALGEVESKVAKHVVKEIAKRLGFLIDVSLGYLTLDRSATTLSGGEAQRIRLAKQISSSLTGIVYILDEPSIGLHQRDNDRLVATMLKLRDLGNTVIVVEHDQAVMEAADLIIDVGPGAGAYGGQIIAQGKYKDIIADPASLTGKYLAGALTIKQPKVYRKGNGKSLEIIGATDHNLKNISLQIPLGKMVAVTGVSGSGKSTLISGILSKALAKHFFRAKDMPGRHKEIKGIDHIDKVVRVDQSAIGKSPRSNPATYTGLFTYIRDLFTQVPEAKLRGYDAGKFSFNVVGGRCENCAGEGMIKIEMQFLPDVFVECETCQGQRYTKDVLEIHFNDKNIADILTMSVDDALRFFEKDTIIHEKLSILNDVGLGYIKLGQPANTLSGGEAQRVKLSTELSRRSTGKTLYILDEPTTGLHMDDINKLLIVLNRLVDKGNTVLIIEHNTDVIRACDWVIDLGPDGGDKGGQVVAQGTPKDVKKVKASYTGAYL
jgi:excinuclease ABC subunit A